jgi:hypothetical protein
MACLEVKSIPQSLLPIHSSGTQAMSNQMTKAIGTLRGYAFIQRQQGNPLNPLYDMHRLVHLATRNWIRQEGSLKEWTRKAAGQIYEVFPYCDHTNKLTWTLYLPHAEKVGSSPDIANEGCRINLLSKMGQCFVYDGQFAKAVETYRMTVSWKEEHFGREHQETLTDCLSLGDALNRDGRWNEAQNFNERAFKEFQTALGEENPSTLASMANLASTYRN